MRVYEVRTTKSDYPFLIVANGYTQAIKILLTEKDVSDDDIKNVRLLDDYESDHVLLEERLVNCDILKTEVRMELEEKLPRWKKMTNGAAGGGERECFLIRSSAGHYFTSACIGGDNYYLVMDDLEQLPGIPKNGKDE